MFRIACSQFGLQILMFENMSQFASGWSSKCVAELPGYARGLAIHDRYAFVGLSKIRETTTFGGVPIAERRDELKCGVWIVDLTAGSVVGFLEFEQDVTEIFDVQILVGRRNPSVIGLQKDTIQLLVQFLLLLLE